MTSPKLAQQVRTALAHLYDPVVLQTHPLTGLLHLTPDPHRGPDPGGGQARHAGVALRQLLLDAIARLRPDATTSEPGGDASKRRAYRLLELRYVEALAPPAVQQQLGIEKSQYYREHQRALDAVVSVLTQELGSSSPVRAAVAVGASPADEEGWLERDGIAGAPTEGPAGWDEAGEAEAFTVSPAGAVDRIDVGAEPPGRLSSFVGREAELAEVRRLMSMTRLLTLTGPGGVGKSRLAQEALAFLGGAYADGAVFVSLGPLSHPVLVAPSVARAVGARQANGRRGLDGLRAHLRDKHLLLVLDNFEHLLPAATLVSDLLASCPRLAAMVTSREVLNLSGEYVFSVPPLTLPAAPRTPKGQGPSAAHDVMRSEAVQLFLARAQAAQPDFAVTPENAPEVAAICRRLDGLPLAIELAAARIRLLPPRTMNALLADRRLAVLTGGPRDSIDRHRTLRQVMAWSYGLLSADEQARFRRLAVCRGGWTLEAAGAVCAGDDAAQALPAQDADGLAWLASLMDKSLVEQERIATAEPRFRMLATVREYALERLQESGEVETVRRRHAAYYLALAERGAGPGETEGSWLDRLEVERGNLRAALQCFADERRAELGIRACAALLQLWRVRGPVREGREWVRTFLAMAEQTARLPVRAQAYSIAGRLAHWEGDLAMACGFGEASLALYRQVGDAAAVAEELGELGWMAAERGEFGAARAHFEASLGLRRDAGDREGIAQMLFGLGVVARACGDSQAARPLLAESARRWHELRDVYEYAHPLATLAEMASEPGGEAGGAGAIYGHASTAVSPPAASRHPPAALSGLGAAVTPGDAILVRDLGHLALRQGDYARAAAVLAATLRLLRRLGGHHRVAGCLAGLAEVARAYGEPVQAARLLGAAEALLTAATRPLSPADEVAYEHTTREVRSQLDEPTFALAWAEGEEMSFEEAISYGLQVSSLAA
ncbi:MAG TPA: AAA family ATPase [Chloroflexota bacterium]|nr:AAA family ATPase [Chloroflexota bacterium]